MSAPIVPISKVGTPFQSPNWRYQATLNPEKFGFEKYCSKPDEANAGNLKRLIVNGVQPVDVYKLPVYIRQIEDQLTPELKQELVKVWNKHYFRRRERKVTFNVAGHRGLLNWNVKGIKKINDDYFRRLIAHCFNIEGNEYISDAIKFYKNPGNVMNCKWMNYSIYGGKTDDELALQWHKPKAFIEALRMIFFDYSGWPKDKLVQYSCLRQLVCNKEIDDQDYHAFKRIYDLGDLGLRSILGHQVLDEKERETVKLYLSGAGIDNLMDQRFAITNLKESISFNRSVAELANVSINRIEAEQRANIMNLTSQRMQKELGINDNDKLAFEDTALLTSMREMMMIDKPGSYPKFIDVIEVKP
jgi:hypothetical protein